MFVSEHDQSTLAVLGQGDFLIMSMCIRAHRCICVGALIFFDCVCGQCDLLICVCLRARLHSLTCLACLL